MVVILSKHDEEKVFIFTLNAQPEEKTRVSNTMKYNLRPRWNLPSPRPP